MFKAFNKHWFKLKQNIVSGNTLTYFIKFKKQRVVLNGELFPWSNIETGVPKGSILGPFSFFIYINDISDDLITNFRLYTDDFLLFYVVDGINLSASNLNSDLTSTKVEIFRLLVLILLPYLCKMSRPYSIPVPNY